MLPLIELLELAGRPSTVQVAPEEYIRLLGYPRGHVLEGRARELADWARQWYAEHGRPWFYARQAESFSIEGASVVFDDVAFNSPRLRSMLREAEAQSVVLVAVGAGKEAEEESRRLWEEEKPDEYFFLEIFGSAVVEHLTTTTGARLCAWAEDHGMAVLPHYSPGYPEWDVAEQPRLLKLMQRTRGADFPSRVEVLESGMPRPKKTLLAVFGVTQHRERLRPLTSLIPCQSCSFGPCQFRRAPYRRAPRAFGEQVGGREAVLDANGRYSVQRRALARWAAERLSLRASNEGSLDAVFRYEGTTCTNMGRPLAFDYHVKLGPREEGYPIRDQRCAPAAGDTGHVHMCQYLTDGDRLMCAIEEDKPLLGQRLNAVLDWHPPMSAAGCFCEPPSRARKWALVLETIHFALVQQESAEDMDIV